MLKIFALFVMFVTLGLDAYGQQEAKVIAELAASSDRVVKNAPFSADAVSESVQVLADGNRIVRRSTTKLYRNAEGRFRRELADSTGGILGAYYTTGNGITILDPIAGKRFFLDDRLKTVRATVLEPTPGLAWSFPARTGAEMAGGTAPSAPSPQVRAMAAELAVATAARSSSGAGVLAPVYGGGYRSNTEDLGSRDFEGISAEGKRTTTTIPAGAIGNERPIEIVFERWFSNDLQQTVYSKHSDPRSGETVYKLENLVRSEPDASLFAVPNGYKVITEPGVVYRIAPPLGVPAIPPTPGVISVSGRPAKAPAKPPAPPKP